MNARASESEKDAHLPFSLSLFVCVGKSKEFLKSFLRSNLLGLIKLPKNSLPSFHGFGFFQRKICVECNIAWLTWLWLGLAGENSCRIHSKTDYPKRRRRRRRRQRKQSKSKAQATT